ncbi:MAG: allantoinase [Geminicoccaceae bacterium]|nr:allantoinase [Geminicoccaceae bacterium]
MVGPHSEGVSPHISVLRAVRGQRILTPEGVRPASIHIVDGRITRLGELDEVAADDASVLDAGELIVLPGLVDTHVHVNDPGRTEWEGFESATRAAAAGGVTTLLDMPLNSIPATTTATALAEKVAAARGKTWVDVGFIGGVVPGNSEALGGLARAGVLAFKCFLVPSGVAEFPDVSEDELRETLPVVAEIGLPLMVHAELPLPIEAATLEAAAGDPTSYTTYLASRPAAAEHEAVVLVMEHAAAFGACVHIVHVSSPGSARLVADGQRRGVRVSAETCPHYLFFEAAEIPPGATEFKCAPPIRGAAEREGLWTALRSGEITMIVSDHSPCPPALKRRESKDFFVAWGGIASLQLGLRAVWTAMQARGIPIERLGNWMCDAPARLVGLGGHKGRIAPGFDADLVLFDPNPVGTLQSGELLHRHPLTPYLGKQLRGVVEATYVRGSLAYHCTTGPVGAPGGRLLLSSHS